MAQFWGLLACSGSKDGLQVVHRTLLPHVKFCLLVWTFFKETHDQFRMRHLRVGKRDGRVPRVTWTPYPVGLLPKPIGLVHVHCCLPLLSLEVVILGLLQSAFSLQLLAKGGSGWGEGDVGPVRGRDGRDRRRAHLAQA